MNSPFTDSYLPSLLKGLLKDKGGIDYSVISITALRRRISELEDIEVQLVEEMVNAKDLFDELIETPRAFKLHISNVRKVTDGMAYYSKVLSWRVALDGKRRSDTSLFNIDSENSIKLLSQLPDRLLKVVADFEKRRVYLNRSLMLVKRDLGINIKLLDEILNVEDVVDHVNNLNAQREIFGGVAYGE